MMQSAAAEIGLFQTVNVAVDHSLTLPDGTVFKTTNQQGISMAYNALKDIGDVAYMKIVGKGKIGNANIATVWPALFT